MSKSETQADNGTEIADDFGSMSASDIEIDNDEMPDDEESDPLEGEDDEDEEPANDDDESEDEADVDETPDDEDDESDDNDDDITDIEAEYDALVSDDGAPPDLDDKAKKYVARKVKGVVKVVEAAKAQRAQLNDLVTVMQRAQDVKEAPAVLKALATVIANHHNMAPEELLAQIGQPETDEDLQFLSWADTDDRKKMIETIQQPLVAHIKNLESKLSAIEADVVGRKKQEEISEKSGRIIRDVAKNFSGWKVTGKMIATASAKFPDLFEKSPRSAVQAAFPSEYAEHYAQARSEMAKKPKNGKIPKGGSPSINGSFDENDPESISSKIFN